MKLVKSFLVLSALAVIFGGMFATAATAQSPEGSYLRLEEPLEIGDTILEPGVYKITVVPGDGRDVLKVTDEDGTKTFATVLATPHATAATADQKRMQYGYFPTATGSTRVLRTWFAPDSANGYDIVYPEPRAMELVTVANGPVVAYKGGTNAADPNTTELEVVSPNGEVMAYVAPGGAMPEDTEESAEVADVAPAGAMPDDTEEPPVQVAQVPRDELSTDDSELPTTASRLPLLAALGFLLLLAAGGVHILRRV